MGGLVKHAVNRRSGVARTEAIIDVHDSHATAATVQHSK
jgi:hypothetical protein